LRRRFETTPTELIPGGHGALQLNRDLDCQHKTAWVAVAGAALGFRNFRRLHAVREQACNPLANGWGHKALWLEPSHLSASSISIHSSHLDKVPGFVEFHLLKGPGAEDHVLYSSHTARENRAVFEAWTRSEAFRAEPQYLDHPQFEGFEVRQTVGRGKADVS
jgi:heme-degrading monooxygenase HmoA